MLLLCRFVFRALRAIEIQIRWQVDLAMAAATKAVKRGLRVAPNCMITMAGAFMQPGGCVAHGNHAAEEARYDFMQQIHATTGAFTQGGLE